MSLSSTMTRTQPPWTSEYWLGHCEGYRVETPKGEAGYVEEVVFDPKTREPTLLLVRNGDGSYGLFTVPVERIGEIRPEAEVISVAFGKAAEATPAVRR